MEKNKNIRAEYCEYVDGYKIDEKGCRHLSKAVWGSWRMLSSIITPSLIVKKIGDRAAGTSGR